ncbi:MAG: hypothetical protein JOY62_00825 [Acidobacteriaceae bacterium]|nr:hypothetical protein [Acidobacteriaceae bacterium]MBV9778489.1 hypothetical protein [Acidobacteriaceae bacterium]
MELTAVQSWGGTYTDSNRWYIRLLPSLTDLAFLIPAFLIVCILPGAKVLLADGDTGWHIRTGEWILQHKAVPMTDLFSFTKPGQSWFAWEWEWDAVFAWIHQQWGIAGVAFANVVLLCVISALLYRLIRRVSGNDVLALLFTLIALLGSTIHWLARPHLFSWLFVLVFLHVIVSAGEGKKKALWCLPFLTVAWVNIHGAFFLGTLFLLLTAAGEAFSAFADEEHGSLARARAKAQPYLLCAAGCFLASFVNPYTWHLHQHILSYLRDSKLLDDIQEFQSVNFHYGMAVFFECMLLLGAASVAWCARRRKFAPVILILVCAHMALVSARNIPIFVFVAAPWVCCMLDSALTQVGAAARFRKFRDAVAGAYHEFQPIESIGRWHLASLAVVLWMAYLLAQRDPRLNASFDEKRFPVQVIPVLNARPAAHIFTSDQWGDYLIYRLYPSRRVFVDGRSDFYGGDFILRCEHILNARYDWQTELKRFGVDMVLLKPDAPLATVLKTAPGWKVLFDDGSAIVFCKGLKTEHDAVPSPRLQTEFSPVFRNGGKELGGLSALQVKNDDSQSITHERRS